MFLSAIPLYIYLTSLLPCYTKAVKNVIYVDQEDGSVDNSCWIGGMDHPCQNFELAREGAKQLPDVVKIAIMYTPNSLHENDDLQHANQSCPTWMYRENNSSACQCGNDTKGAVKCNAKLNTVSLLDCHCMTYDNDSNSVVTGECFYGYQIGSVYQNLPSDVLKLNEFMCGKLNRDGRLCARCKEGYSPLVYSYDFKCVKCSNSNYNWVKFIALALTPSTFFFFLVVIFRINALSPQLHGFVQISQAFGAAINIRILLFASDGYVLELAKLIAIPYGIVNLDFFRTFVTTICVDLTTLQTLALDYVTAVYPLLLLTVTYIFIELHAKNCKLIVWIWKPFRRLFSGAWDIHSSIIKAFATFILLSYGKLLSVTFDLLIPTRIYDVRGNHLGFYLYYDASYKYFSPAHLPYAILALIVALTLLLPPPFLLFVYPMSWFQKCLNHRGLALHTFVECFHGYYKDGTDPGTHDCRWIAAVYFFGKIIFVFIFSGITKNVLCYTFTVISITGFAIIIIIVKPYKSRYSTYNTVDASLLLLIAMWCASVISVNEARIRDRDLVTLAYIMTALSSLMPLVYIFTLLINCLRKTCLKKCNKLQFNHQRGLSDSNFEWEREPLLSHC